jgi:hypothetical protein
MVENKSILLISWAGDFNAGVQAIPRPWADPAVRRYITEHFLCAQTFSQDNRFGQPRYLGDSFPKIFVLTSDGRELDVLPPNGVLSWRDALDADLSGSNYAAWLRQQIPRRGAAGDAFQNRLVDALLTRGEVEAAVDEMLRQRGPDSLYDSSGSYRFRSLAESPEVRTLLERRLAAAAARLQLDARDTASATALYRASSGLRATDAWRRFPSLLPSQNPAYWRLVSEWLLRSNPTVYHRAANEAIDLQQFVAAGRDWARDWLADVKRSPSTDYRMATTAVRYRLISVGIRAIQMLVHDEKLDAARRVAALVLQWDSSNDIQQQVKHALAGQLPARGEAWWWR